MSDMLQKIDELSEYYDSLLHNWIIGIVVLFTVGTIIAIIVMIKDDFPFVLWLPAILCMLLYIGIDTILIGKEAKDRYEIAEELLPPSLTDKTVTKFPLNYDDSKSKLCKIAEEDKCVTIVFHDSEGHKYEVFLLNEDYYKLEQNKTYSVSFPLLSKVDIRALERYNLEQFYFDAVKIEELKPTKQQ